MADDDSGLSRMPLHEMAAEGERRMLETLVATACERWLGWCYYGYEYDEDGRATAHPGWINPEDQFAELPAPDGNLLLRLCDAMRAAGYTVAHEARDGTVECNIYQDVDQTAALESHLAEAIAPTYLEATLRAACEVPR